MYTNVTDILSKSTSDKENGHRYGIIYDLLLNTLRLKIGRSLNILELGVSQFGSGSLKAFAKLSIVRHIVGVDLEPYDIPPRQADKITFHQLDVYSEKTIKTLKRTHGEFDIIIDDATHERSDQLYFLHNYDQLRSEHGILICEDVWSPKLIYQMPDDVYVLDLRYNTYKTDNILLIRGGFGSGLPYARSGATDGKKP